MNVLFLTPWYPNKLDAMSGLFVRKHAMAVARQGHCVHVLYAQSDKRFTSFEYEYQEYEGVHEHYVYYPERSSRIKGLFGFLKANRMLVAQMELRGFKPDVIQLNVLTKNGLLAYLLHNRYRCPYVIMEHWSGYLPENNAYNRKPHKLMAEFVARHADCIMPCSEFLHEAMVRCKLSHPNYKTVFNVVDDFFYTPPASVIERKQGKFRFIHVSCFDNAPKNVFGIIKAVDLLRQKRTDFELIMVGAGFDFEETVQLANQLELNEYITFTGEKTPEEVKDWLYGSDAFVLFSNYDNTPVVLEESLATGCPIISTPVGIAITEIDAQTGIIVPKGDEAKLAESMSYMIDNYNKYDKTLIRKKAVKYTFDAVGGQLSDIYETAINQIKPRKS